MARKKKQSRKYIPMDEIRVNNSPLADGHPHHVFGKTRNGKKYKSVGYTHSPNDEQQSFLLSRNPNPNDKDKAYLQSRVHTARTDFYSEPLHDWKLAKEDRPILRHITKQYKKRTNRKPPNWYVNKKRKKKK